MKQSFIHHQLSPNNCTRQHVYLRTPPRREHRMLFAEIGSQSQRSTPTSLPSIPFSSRMQHHLRSLSMPRSVTCEL